MDLSQVHDRYSAASARASEISRQLAFAGIAIVWLFSGGDVSPSGGIEVAHRLVLPGALLVGGLLLDFAHALYQAALWGVVGWKNERAGTRDIEVSRWALRPSVGFFWLKFAAVGAAYVLLAVYFVGKVF